MRKSTVKAVHLLKAAILLLSAVYCLFMPVMTGLGLLYNRASYGKFLTLTGVYFIVSALLMTAGTVMCGSRKKAKNVLSVIFWFWDLSSAWSCFIIFAIMLTSGAGRASLKLNG